MESSAPLFAPDLPPGFQYRDFTSAAGEHALLEAIDRLEFSDFEMRGVVARRRVAFFGESYDRAAAPRIPDFLRPLRAKIAEWVGLESLSTRRERPSGHEARRAYEHHIPPVAQLRYSVTFRTLG